MNIHHRTWTITRNLILALACIAVLVCTVALDASAQHPSDRPVAKFGLFENNHRISVTQIVVKGRRCLTAEDTFKLRLVAFQPDRDRVVYRCVQP